MFKYTIQILQKKALYKEIMFLYTNVSYKIDHQEYESAKMTVKFIIMILLEIKRQ